MKITFHVATMILPNNSQDTVSHIYEKRETARSFFFVRSIYAWKRIKMSTYLLIDLAVNVMHDHTILILKTRYILCLHEHPPA